MELQPCIRCGRKLKAPQGINATGDRAFSFFVSSVTRGIRPRVKSRAQQLVFCVPCGVSIALGPSPEGAFNFSVWQVLRDMLAKERDLLNAAWEQVVSPNARLKAMPGSKPDKAFALALPEPGTRLAASG
jgi:hypothetical protein